MSETPFYFQLGKDRLFAVLHRPQGAVPRRGVVLCHAMAEEKLWSHRVYANLARDLAAGGMSVLRFDFRGEGDSDWEFEQAGLATKVEDVFRAVEVLLEREPALRAAVLIGHRLGAAVAAEAAARLRSRVQALIAWDPIVDGRGYLMHLLRCAMASRMALAGSAPTRAALLKELESGRTVVVDGYGITPAFSRELLGMDWPRSLAAASCPTLVIEGECEPAFWRESKRLHRRAAAMTARSLEWVEGHPA